MKRPWAKKSLEHTAGSAPSREPKRCRLIPDHVPPRFIDCPNYSVCLREVAVANWESWSCRQCTWAPPGLVYEKIEASSIEHLLYPDEQASAISNQQAAGSNRKPSAISNHALDAVPSAGSNRKPSVKKRRS